ncbi:MAG: DUF2935 domain-containing protein [Oscillospiraceae bacterium]|jgi:hypothetical protein|nr:DUF2935 domain-containing protein [Oscillospiraceae bacterium]
MLNQRMYVTLSLELHLFFARIMKEHSFFLEAGFTPKNEDLAKEADDFKKKFEGLLSNVVSISNGMIRPAVLSSGEIVTDYTLGAEQKSHHFTGIPLNHQITIMESQLHSGRDGAVSPELESQVRRLNREAIMLLDGLIAFKQKVLNAVLSCNIFTVNYPLLLEHILREAKQYRDHVESLEQGKDIDTSLKETTLFWNQIMLEHALFIRGLLDPSENKLVQTANNFAHEYDDLLKEARRATDMTIASVANDALKETVKYREFKEAGTKGISECKIRSIILPLLADHVLREANHYIRLLKEPV